MATNTARPSARKMWLNRRRLPADTAESGALMVFMD